jgi:hypothetical protein
MRTQMLVLSVMAISLFGMGITAAAGFGFNGLFKAGFQHNDSYSWNSPYNGIGGRMSYNGIRYNVTAFVANIVKSKAAVAQCKTTYANNVSATTSNGFGISVSTSKLDQANANLQANVTANATSWYTRMSLALFQNAFQAFSLQYRLATHLLNATQKASLRASLNGTRSSLVTCVSSNSISQGRGIGVSAHGGGFGFQGFGWISAHGRR